jgi:glycerophosphoryl diester phosphodiesterase
MRRREPVLVSAHRCLTRAQVDHALSLDVDYVELDVQFCADRTFVIFHDAVVAVDGTDVPLVELTLAELLAVVPDALPFAEALDALAGRKHAHLDLKFDDGCVEAAALAVERLGEDRLVVTTLHDASVHAVRAWADDRGLAVRVGLSLGRGVAGFPVWRQVRVRASEIWPHVRYRRSRANAVVAHHWLARLGVGGEHRERPAVLAATGSRVDGDHEPPRARTPDPCC